jgi:hypothetical protein
MVELNRPKGAGLKSVDATAAKLQWPAALSSGSQFTFERRRVVPNPQGGIMVQWEALPDARVEHVGDNFVATLSKLSPGEMYGVRVVATGEDGGKPLFTQYFSTTPRPQLLPKITVLRVLLLGLAICGGLVWRQRRAQRAAQ